MITLADTKYLEDMNVLRLKYTHNINELAEFKFDADTEYVGSVDYWAHEFVIVGEEVVIEALRVGVASGGSAQQAACRQPPYERSHQLTGSAIVT